MVVTKIESDAEYGPAVSAAGGKLVVIDFFATWCGPCTRIAPKFEALSNENPTAAFLKVDVDKCSGTSAAAGVSAMPTFHFLLNGAKVDALTGGDPAALEAKVKKWAASSGAAADEGAPKGQLDMSSFFDKKGLECLNEDDAHSLRDLLGGGSLRSDCDAQLIINIPFNQPVKLHSLVLKAPKGTGPKNVKLFINNPSSLDFDKAEGTVAVQDIAFSPEQLASGELITLRYVKFQNVQSLQVFVADNQEGSEQTFIEGLKFYGSPITATNMSEFKRVAGKAGEGGH